MAIDNLLRPDNRLFGPGTADLSTFGAQPDPAVVFSRPGEGAAAPIPSAAPGSADPAITPPAEARAPDAADTPTATDADQGPTPSPSTGVGTTAEDQPAPRGESAAAELPPVGGGSTSPIILAPSGQTAPDGSSVASSASPVADLLGGQSFATGAPVVASVAGPVMADVAMLAPVVAQLTQAEALLAQTTDTLTDAIPDDLDSLLTGTVGVLDDLIGATGATAGSAQAAVGDLAGAAGTLAQTPIHDIDSLIFSGTDPAAGITTLVGLVQTSELFTVGQGEAAPQATAAGSIVDDLIGDPGVPPLSEDGPLHDPLGDDDGIGLGL